MLRRLWLPQAIMDEIKAGLRYMFQTESKYVCCISGTGSPPPLSAPCRPPTRLQAVISKTVSPRSGAPPRGSRPPSAGSEKTIAM